MTTNTSILAGIQQFVSDSAFRFINGQEIHSLTLAYETYGELNADKSNAILVHHALSTNSHLSSTKENSDEGWWEKMVGPNKPIDTQYYFIICINNLGSCFGSSGPTTINPNTQKAYQADFPVVTIRDMVNSQKCLIDHLGIQKLHAVIGSSMGAMLSLEWAIAFPETVKRLVSISSSYKSYPANSANRAIQREIIKLDPNWNDGFYSEAPLKGFKLARKLGHISYRHPSELNARFSNVFEANSEREDIESYLDYNSEKFVSKFDANSYLYLLLAMDLFDVTQEYGHEAFERIKAKALIVSITSDILYPPTQQAELFDAFRKAKVHAEFVQHNSDYGHDAFLVETETIGSYITRFITE